MCWYYYYSVVVFRGFSVCEFFQPKMRLFGNGGWTQRAGARNFTQTKHATRGILPRQATNWYEVSTLLTGNSEAGGGDATHSPGGEGVTPEISRNAAPHEETRANDGSSRRGGGAAKAARPRTAWNSGVMEEDVERNGALAGGRRVDYCLQVIDRIIRRRSNNTRW